MRKSIEKFASSLTEDPSVTAPLTRRRLIAKVGAASVGLAAAFGMKESAEAAYYTYVIRNNTPCRSAARANASLVMTLPCGTYFSTYDHYTSTYNQSCNEYTNYWNPGTFYNQYGVSYYCYVHRGNCRPGSTYYCEC